MNKQEVRLGNLVLTNGRVDDITLSWFECCTPSMDGDDISEDTTGIPLTEEWLLRLGFEKQKNSRKFYPGSVFKFTMNTYKAWFCVFLFEYHATGESHVGFRSYIESESHNEVSYNDNWCYSDSVHKLQNLYFALTGEELTIKP